MNVHLNKTNYSEGCAIGRLLAPEDALLFDEGRDVDVGSSIHTISEDYPKFMERLPKNVRKLSVEFLNRLQGLHDVEANWDEKGLSDYGISGVNSIIHDYKIRMKYLK